MSYFQHVIYSNNPLSHHERLFSELPISKLVEIHYVVIQNTFPNNIPPLTDDTGYYHYMYSLNQYGELQPPTTPLSETLLINEYVIVDQNGITNCISYIETE